MLRHKNRPMVRPWALLTPIVVLVIALPLLRPLRQPDPRAVADPERSIYATVQAVAEHGTLAIERTEFVHANGSHVARDGHLYSVQPPTFAVLLSGSYWMMHRWGTTFADHGGFVAYFLTLLGSTLPVALASGLVYRMGRLFELRRPWRAGLALASVLATGFISYATVLNPHAPAAALVLCAAACLIHLTITNRRLHSSIWLVVCGFCAALAAAIDPPAVVFLILFLPVVFAFRWPVLHRVAGGVAFVAGAVGPIVLHVALAGATGAGPLEGLGFGRSGTMTYAAAADAHAYDAAMAATGEDYDEYADAFFDEPPTAWSTFVANLRSLWTVMAGPHGLLSHFPVLVVGLAGVTAVMHRHWPATTKWLACATLGGAGAIILAYALGDTDWGEAMFATRFFVVFLPLTFFWAGAWLRRQHRPAAWVVACAMLGFSTFASLVGATGPLPHDGFRARDGRPTYTVAGALSNLIHPRPIDLPPAAMAGQPLDQTTFISSEP